MIIKGWAKKILVLLLVCIPASFLLLTPGFYEPQDLHHVADIYQMVRAIGSGQLPPRLGPDFMFGHGYPLFNFYYPLPFYLGALFFFLIGSLTISFKLVFVLIILVSALGMYLFLKEFLDEFSSLVGSLLFLYTPYRAVQIYVRGAIGEALALAILPVFAWSMVKLLKKPTHKVVALAGLLGGVFILSHNYFWALAAPWLVTLIFTLEYKNKVGSIAKLILAAVSALALSAYWWLPALIEQKLVSGVTPFPLIDHFPFISQLIIPSWGYGASLWGPSDGMSFQIGLTNLAVIVGLIVMFVLQRKRLKAKNLLSLSTWVLIGFIVNVFLMNVRSYPLWKLLPFHDFIQFPWRLLAFTTFFTAVGAGIVVNTLEGKKKYILGGLIGVLSFALTISYFRPSQKFYKTDNDYLHRFFANRSIEGQTEGASKEYLLYSEDYLQLPYWVSERPSELPVSKISSTDSKVSEIRELNPVSWEADVETTGPASVTFNEMYFPGWAAYVDGRRVPVNPTGPNGDMLISIKDKGSHNIKFLWTETPFRRAADIVSLGTLISIIVVFVFSKKYEE